MKKTIKCIRCNYFKQDKSYKSDGICQFDNTFTREFYACTKKENGIYMYSLIINKKLNKLQEEIFNFLKSNNGKSFTPEYLHINNFKEHTLRKLKYNLTLLVNKEIGIEEEFVCLKDSGYVYSNGFYYKLT